MTALFRGPITGPKAFAIFASFFITVIGVNVVLAVMAVRTFPGVEVESSYVASQTFDADRTAQEALGWTARATLGAGELVLTLVDAQGRPAQAASVAATMGRATEEASDRVLTLAFDGAAWRAPVLAAPGRWTLRLEALATDGTAFRQHLAVHVE